MDTEIADAFAGVEHDHVEHTHGGDGNQHQITRRLVERFARRHHSETPTIPRDLAALTARELEVLRLLADGLNNAEIADRLTVSEATVKTHVAHILAKLRLRDRVQAVVLAYQTGLINLAPSP